MCAKINCKRPELILLLIFVAIMLVWYNQKTREISDQNSGYYFKKLGPSKSVLEGKSLISFFPNLGNSTWLVSWTDPIITSDMLIEALNAPNVTIVTARVVGIHPVEDYPLLGSEEDLTLHDFFAHALQYGNKAIELQFKSTSHVRFALEIIKIFEPQVNVPIIFSAPIVHPAGLADEAQVDASTFLSLTSRYFPWSILSVSFGDHCLPRVAIAGIETMSEELQLHLDSHGKNYIFLSLLMCQAMHLNVTKLLAKLTRVNGVVIRAKDPSVEIKDLLKFGSHSGNVPIYYDVSSQIRKELQLMYKNAVVY